MDIELENQNNENKMNKDSIFEEPFSINKRKWYDKLYSLTPIEEVDGMLVKREDKFAPLGYGGINGSKLRQCIWLIDEYVKNTNNPVGIISGSSVKSPQLPMGSAVALHYGLKSIHVIGATTPEASIKRENVKMASWFGAKFHFVRNIAYNAVLQKRVSKLLNERQDLSSYFYLEYGITLNHHIHHPSRIENFHRLGAEQVKNIPDSVETLIVPAGSCNSCTSILYGISKNKPKKLKNIYLIGIGPQKIDLVEERLKIIKQVTNVNTNIFKRDYVHQKEIQSKYENNILEEPSTNEINLIHHDLHETKYVDYQDEMEFTLGNIELHPTYEGKVAKYVSENIPSIWKKNTTCLWIVGSKPRKEPMYEHIKQEIGEYPTEVKEYV